MMEFFGEREVGFVSGTNGDDMGQEVPSDEGEISDEIENFVADHFVWKEEPSFAEDDAIFDDNGVVEAAASDEPTIHKCGDFVIEGKGATRGDFIFEGAT